MAGDFRINLYRKDAVTDQNGVIDPKMVDTNGTRSGINSERDLNANEKTILQVLKINPRITQKDICTKTDISLRTVKRIMRELQNLGKLRREGTNRNGLWVVIDQNE